MAFSWRKLLHWGGSFLAVLSLLFVALRLRQYGTQFDPAAIPLSHWLIIAGLALIYALANGPLVLAWHCLLRRFDIRTSRRWAVRAYGLSQLAKYLPGNILHVAGRQALGMAAGWPGRGLAKSIAFELALLAGAGGLFVALLVPVLFSGLPWLLGPAIWCLVVVLGMYGVYRFLGRDGVSALAWQILFLLISASIFVALVELTASQMVVPAREWPVIAGAFVVAWLAGLVTPGAPAGVGVRELVLLLVLKPVVAEADLLLAVVLGRVVTVCGDLLFFCAALAVRDLDSGKH
ncbi:hypothetical protein KW851_02485 [Pseudomonas sp. PDM33]|uniref:hypothetical protein n=1 Tax=unclassified Pseudomonas TaxID=196821 RepID=UPI0005EB9BEC|nr:MULTISPECIES: hypothetical protein [unclassified Pseudomonas]MBV7581667.1 hypothetical protein [Pseudomonas sp. PDM33]